jgi:hypothetical protein
LKIGKYKGKLQICGENTMGKYKGKIQGENTTPAEKYGEIP